MSVNVNHMQINVFSAALLKIEAKYMNIILELRNSNITQLVFDGGNGLVTLITATEILY